VKVVNREELKEKLERGADIKLVMAMERHAYDLLHIPGSLHFDGVTEAAQRLNPVDEVIVYCSTRVCNSGIDAYLRLRARGFDNLYLYAGGLEEWLDAGYELEGRLANDERMLKPV